MKDKKKKTVFWILVSIHYIIFAISIGISCYDEYLIRTKELVIDSCIVRGISYDGNKTLVVVELPDDAFAIVDATIYQYRSIPDHPRIQKLDLIRCRWKDGDTGKLGYSSKQKGDLYD